MKCRIGLLLLLLFCSANLNGQQDPSVLRSWPGTAERIAADPSGKIYLVRNGILTCFTEQGDSLYSWSDPASGRITGIDLTDPLRLLVYQKDFNLLRFLNNRLAPLAEAISLDQLDIPHPLALATSRQGGFWVLDGTTLRLRRYDHQLNLRVESSPLILPDSAGVKGIQLIESADRIWLLVTGVEIRQFDSFGNFVRRIPLKVNFISPYGEQLLLVRTDRITLLSDAFLPETPVLEWPRNTLLEAILLNDRMLLRTAREVILIRH